ncbi:MAG: DUF4299 family protein [Ruminococcaceae bacterium]|nr:DUF4299 family protein [Oscillospiraceae bacterium]
MSLNVEITQTGLIKKTLPLEVILGDELDYGTFATGYLLEERQLGDTSFIAYNPKCIARGFSVEWTEKEKHKVSLSLPLYTTDGDIADFMHCVKRITDYWNGCKVTVDDEPTTAEEFLQRFDELCALCADHLRSTMQQILDGECQSFILISAKLPLSFGTEEARNILTAGDSMAALADFLHEKQSLDAFYPTPRFYKLDDSEILGVICYFNGIRCILPTEPTVPFGITAPDGQALKPDRWTALVSTDGKSPSMTFDGYTPLLEHLPKEKCSRFDGGHIVVEALTPEEHEALAAAADKQE